MKTKSIARTLAGFVLFFLGLAGIVYAAGSAAISRPPVAELPLPSGLTVEEVWLKDPGQPDLAGWVAEGSNACGAALILHGRGGSRETVAGRARLLHDAGISVVLFDLPGHGASGGEVRGFGFEEATAVARMGQFLETRFPERKTAAIGASLGAAALVLAHDQFKPDAYVLEELFATLQETTARRMRLPVFKDAQASVMLAQLPWRLGFSADDVRPVDQIADIKSPVLMLAGSDDPFADPVQTKAVFDAVTAPKQLVVFDGARHQNLQVYDPGRYAETVLPFIRKSLCNP